MEKVGHMDEAGFEEDVEAAVHSVSFDIKPKAFPQKEELSKRFHVAQVSGGMQSDETIVVFHTQGPHAPILKVQLQSEHGVARKE